MKKFSAPFVTVLLFFYCYSANGQIDSSLLKSVGPKDTVKKNMNMDAVFTRPFLKIGNMPMSIGGYLESNWQYVSTSGIAQGNQFEFRRLSLFFATTISKHIKFMSEIEYENDPTGDADAAKGGGFEVEYAAVDIELHPLLNIRAGMILNPIGAFNENHDGPKWEFTDRPIAMTQLLPDTWSNTGFGLFGKQYKGHWMFGYEFYVTGGFNDSIIDNSQGKTYLPAAENNPSRFTSSASGAPMYSGRLSVRQDQVGELGLSFMSDVYNTWEIEGAQVDNKRTVNVFDVDYNTTIPKLHTKIVTEWVWIFVQIPPNYTPEYASRQFGGFIDIVQPILSRRMFGWDNATLNFAVRGEYVDWNVGNFAATGTRMYNDLWSIMPAISFRPTSSTVLRLNYRHQMQRDITGNTVGATIGFTAGFSLGLSTYF
jgi:hypothetical protein